MPPTSTVLNNRILVADDEADVANLVGMNLTNAGFQVLKAVDGPSALALARREAPALIVLDIMMPGMSGLDVCRTLKREVATASIGIVLLSARAEEVDRVLGFELGVDDYVTKPFSPRELVLRVKSILRRRMEVAVEGGAPISVGAITVDAEQHVVLVEGKPVEPTSVEYKLLLALMSRAGRVFGREELLARVWGLGAAIEVRTVDTHMRRLREKLGAAAAQIQTVRGFGYRIEPGAE
jgi:two-component system phosphate regulon response regulator PhoB